jgi:hypothetical protein
VECLLRSLFVFSLLPSSGYLLHLPSCHPAPLCPKSARMERTHTDTHGRVLRHTHRHTWVCTHTHRHHTWSCTHTHTQIHKTHMGVHARASTHTHTHTHTPKIRTKQNKKKIAFLRFTCQDGARHSYWIVKNLFCFCVKGRSFQGVNVSEL